jgi:ribonuclease VapC
LIVDTSALVTVVLREQGYERFEEALRAAPTVGVGAPTLVETGVVLHGRIGALARTVLIRLLDDVDATTIAFGDRHWHVALGAHARFGRGRHRAALNFGDCLTYAAAKVANEPLLCRGDDFAHTDLELA